MIAFYNEIDDYCCAWLSNLMDAGHITPGIISNESIEDITPAELVGYDRVHLFAGIGVWDYALRLAGWPSDRPVWTLSCPCQPFSTAGKGVGFDDKRHLWPHAQWLIEQCRPVELIGEQVASGHANAWIDLVHADLEALGYAFGCVPFPSAGVGAPHIRDRAYWVANTELPTSERFGSHGRQGVPGGTEHVSAGSGGTERMANSELSERGPRDFRGTAIDGQAGGRNESANRIGECGGTDGLEHASRDGREQRRSESDGRGVVGGCGVIGLGDSFDTRLQERQRLAGISCEPLGTNPGQAVERAGVHPGGVGNADMSESLTVGTSGGEQPLCDERGLPIRETGAAGPTNGAWPNADWLFCRDGKWRPVESGYVQMVDGSSRSLGSLRTDTIEKIEKEINDWAIRHKTESGKALHDVRDALESEAKRIGETGRLSSVLEAPVLLAFLLQFEAQRRSISQSVSRASAEKEETVLRVLRYDHTTTGTSRRRGLDEQYRYESSNPLHLLSSILAQNALEAWGEDALKNACDTSPLSEAAPARMQRLRGYGNAINARQAQVFLEAYLEI